jgi:hypothetical protein
MAQGSKAQIVSVSDESEMGSLVLDAIPEIPQKRRSHHSIDLLQFPDLSEEDKKAVRAIEGMLAAPTISPEDTEALQVARRVILSYGGVKGFTALRDMLKAGINGPEIAKKFGVTRQRAHQWGKALGTQTCVFSERVCIEKLAISQGATDAA